MPTSVAVHDVGGYDADAFAFEWNVPRGTMLKLHRYAALLTARQATMNLVAASTLPDLWQRHFRDSAQLARLADPGSTWLDIGAGGGFPGLVLAAMDVGHIRLVEATAKKCVFLREVVEALALAAEVLHGRAEMLPPQRVDVITARAVAPLAKLFDWGYRHSHDETRWILPKGRTAMDEVSAARNLFRFDQETVVSVTSPDSTIIVARRVERKSIRR